MNCKNIKSIFLVLTAMLMLAACHDDEELPTARRIDCAVLPTVFAPISTDDDLLPMRQKTTMIINSPEELHETQTARFIEKNPGWLNVDFDRKTIIAYRGVTAYGDRWTGSRVVDFVQCIRNFDIYKKGDYILSLSNFFNNKLPAAESYEKTHLSFQIAIVCDKIPSDATVTTMYDERYE